MIKAKRCPHDHLCPTSDVEVEHPTPSGEVRLEGGWKQPTKPEKCDICPTGNVGIKYKIGGDMVVRRIAKKEDQVDQAEEYRACKRDGCLIQVGPGEDKHPGECLLFDFDKPKIHEEVHGWAPSNDMLGDA